MDEFLTTPETAYVWDMFDIVVDDMGMYVLMLLFYWRVLMYLIYPPFPISDRILAGCSIKPSQCWWKSRLSSIWPIAVLTDAVLASLLIFFFDSATQYVCQLPPLHLSSTPEAAVSPHSIMKTDNRDLPAIGEEMVYIYRVSSPYYCSDSTPVRLFLNISLLNWIISKNEQGGIAIMTLKHYVNAFLCI